ncbi:cyclic GMP-AMP synthase DncV-like nucleotidyltransferase [Aquiflexum sp.]|uniref:cyclic GMP-AMP synthase DncV-like nucleotidyltransferase n=1 Tax=Aquiflexum sp. TaxID=1872584 RepID=UPI0035945EEF
MANCHNLFLEFHDEISIGSSKKNRMISSKESLRRRIRKWFKENHPEYVPKFYIQGSHKMKSSVRTKEDICDLDDGIYFFREPDVSPTTIQGWVWEAVNGYTETSPEHRKKCIRSIFSGDYEIDHPVYYKVDGENYKLAIKNGDFEDSDPKEMVEWFQRKKDKDGKLIRNVKYLKDWCDYCDHKMPSGLAMTILATNASEKIVLNQRDDITLRDFLKEIKKELDRDFKCLVPAVPNDDLFAGYDEDRINSFLTSLNRFIEDADKALREENQLVASKLWRKHLGDRFPEGKNEKRQYNSLHSAAILAGASTSNPWACE